MIKINLQKASVSETVLAKYQSAIDQHTVSLENKTGKGNDFLGWLHLPTQMTEAEITKIEQTASKIKQIAEIFVVIGIGGSYLGAKAVIDALSHHFASVQTHAQRKAPLVVFAGQNLCADYHTDLFDMLKDKSYAVAVISKSGTTTEPAVAFRLLKQDLEKRYGKAGAQERIIAVTDFSRGALRQLTDQEGYVNFGIPDDVGGRYSVLTAVGLLPIAVAGFDIRQIIDGAKSMESETAKTTQIGINPVSSYAAIRTELHKNGKEIEILVSYHPKLVFLAEWWKQLYGESEGKENKGIFPASVNFTSDLHSMGQWIQEGKRTIFETVLSVEKTKSTIEVPTDAENLDKLNFLAGQTLTHVNKMAEKGTLIAHIEGGVPNIAIEVSQINAFTIGELIYFFEKACALSGYLADVNPFDQPGVEAYKTNMFALLGKAGFEKLQAEILAKL